MVVEGFGTVGCQVLAVAVGPLTVVESHSFGRPERQFGGTWKERLTVDEFGLIAAVHRSGQSVIEAIPDGADRRQNPLGSQTLGERHRGILRSRIAVMNE